MTRITTFQAAGILVAALMCFSEECYAYNKNTTRPITTTEATINGPTTKNASNMTTTGPIPTTASNMTTIEPTTTAESNMTTTGRTTITASNMTTTGRTTITATNMTTTGPTTTAKSNMTTTGPTTTAASITTTTGRTTITQSNMTTIEHTTASNMKTAVSNMTTESGTTSITPSAPEDGWKVRDKDGNLCMLMDFNGTITDVVNGVTAQIPSHASTSASDCSSSLYSAFVLDFYTTFTEWGIVMNFTTRGGSYKLHILSASRSTFRTPLSSSVTKDFFDVPLGDYYTCSHFNYSLGYFQLNLTEPSLQPFVNETEGGDNFGQPHGCQQGTSGSDVAAIITSVFSAIGAVGGAIASIIAIWKGCNGGNSRSGQYTKY